jgi:hypothetical protein
MDWRKLIVTNPRLCHGKPVVLLVGLPGDVESEESYREQLQGWLEVVAGGGQAARVFVLCDDPTNQVAVISNQSPVTLH